MYAKLGNIVFELNRSFNGMSDVKAYDYAEHAVVEGKPRLQFVAHKLETIELRFIFNRGFCSPQQELDKLTKAAGQYEPMAFIFGNGTNRGTFVVEEIDTTTKQTAADGTLMAIEVNVKLKEWVMDAQLTAVTLKSTVNLQRRDRAVPGPQSPSPGSGAIVRQQNNN